MCKESLNEVFTLFVSNGYPRRFVRAIKRNTSSTKSHQDDKQENIYLKPLYINEEFKRRALSVIRKLEIIHVHFMNGRPLSQIFTPPSDTASCPDDCRTCKSVIISKQCLTKNVVYENISSQCGIKYVGDTVRTIR